jgi:hypothetical protein
MNYSGADISGYGDTAPVAVPQLTTVDLSASEEIIRDIGIAVLTALITTMFQRWLFGSSGSGGNK